QCGQEGVRHKRVVLSEAGVGHVIPCSSINSGESRNDFYFHAFGFGQLRTFLKMAAPVFSIAARCNIPAEIRARAGVRSRWRAATGEAQGSNPSKIAASAQRAARARSFAVRTVQVNRARPHTSRT